MSDRDILTASSRERMREEIAQQIEDFLSNGGRIEYLHNLTVEARPIGRVWQDVRGGLLLNV